MAKKITKKVIKINKISDNYTLSLSLNGKVYESKGDNLEKAFIDLKPEMFKTKGFLTVKKGERQIIRVLNIPQMKRIFGIGGTNTQKMVLDFNIKFLRQMLGER